MRRATTWKRSAPSWRTAAWRSHKSTCTGWRGRRTPPGARWRRCWDCSRSIQCSVTSIQSRRLMMDEVDYLKAELDDLRYREQRRMDDEIRAHKERDRERKAVY